MRCARDHASWSRRRIAVTSQRAGSSCASTR
jgi:hypothetical protein